MKTLEKLEALGFKKAGDKLRKIAEKKRKMAIAYEHYRFVTPEKVRSFNERLKEKTLVGEEPYNATWKTLSFSSVEQYDKVPPDHVLDSMSAAVERKCFDSFEIAYIKEVKDPVLFGSVNGCPDLFFIDQWDDDVKIQDILKENEG